MESVDLRQGSLPPKNTVSGRTYDSVLFFLSIFFWPNIPSTNTKIESILSLSISDLFWNVHQNLFIAFLIHDTYQWIIAGNLLGRSKSIVGHQLSEVMIHQSTDSVFNHPLIHRPETSGNTTLIQIRHHTSGPDLTLDSLSYQCASIKMHHLSLSVHTVKPSILNQQVF